MLRILTTWRTEEGRTYGQEIKTEIPLVLKRGVLYSPLHLHQNNKKYENYEQKKNLHLFFVNNAVLHLLLRV